MGSTLDLHADLVAAGQQIDSHESDLYVLDTPEARRIIAKHMPDFNVDASVFTSARGDGSWIDVPFAFTPWWAARAR